MCQHPAHQVNVSRKGHLCAPDYSNCFRHPVQKVGLKDIGAKLKITLYLILWKFQKGRSTTQQRHCTQMEDNYHS